MPKTKVYFCTKTKNFKVCGETDPSKFVDGRYSTCKECRNKYVRDYNKEKKLNEAEEKNKEIDPSANIRYLIIDTIRHAPIMDGHSVEEKIRGNEDDISEVLCTNSDNLDKFKIEIYKEFNKLHEKIRDLEQEILKIKESKS
jgi:hypothetical protein